MKSISLHWLSPRLSALLLGLGCSLAMALDFDVATAYPADNFHTINLTSFAADVAKMTEGTVNLHVYPNATLLKPGDIFPAVRNGRVAMGEVIMSSLAAESPLFGLDSIPFVVGGYADAAALWKFSRGAIERALAARNITLLYAVPWPPQNLYCDRPITTSRDLRGLRLRTYNPATQRIADLVGATQVSIQVVDLGRAIGDKGLDWMITSSWTGVETKAWRHLPYYYTVNAWIPKNIVFMNKSAFDNLDASTQAKIRMAAARAEERGWASSQDNAKNFEAILAENKVTVAAPSAFLSDEFRRIGETLSREWLRQSGPDGLDILLKYEMSRFEQHS